MVYRAFMSIWREMRGQSCCVCTAAAILGNSFLSLTAPLEQEIRLRALFRWNPEFGNRRVCILVSVALLLLLEG